MSAEVETMFYLRKEPWHGLGTQVMEAPNSREALKHGTERIKVSDTVSESSDFSLFPMDEKGRVLCRGSGRLCKRGNCKDEICRGKCEREMMHV